LWQLRGFKVSEDQLCREGSFQIPSGKPTKNYGTSPFSSWVNPLFLYISMVFFNSYFDITRGYPNMGSSREK